MNCILICLFISNKYFNLLPLLLESILLYGKLSPKEYIIIYTSSQFKQKLSQLKIISQLPITFEINDQYHTVLQACASRLDFFTLPNTKKATNCLYLDLDIIIKDDIKPIFSLTKQDLLYTLEEGTIDEGVYPNDHWGKSLFGDTISSYTDKSAFTSGILLFKNSTTMENLFKTIKNDIATNPLEFNTKEQPFIIYHTIRLNLHNNKILKDYASNFCPYLQHPTSGSSHVIYHFPYAVGDYAADCKLKLMKEFLNIIENYYPVKTLNNIDIFTDIWTCSNKMRLNIKDFFQNCNSLSPIVELGSHLGHTAGYLATIFPHVYCIDNSQELLEQNKHNNKSNTNISYINFDLYTGDWTSLPLEMTSLVEIVFIDAMHEYHTCSSDIFNSLKFFPKLKYIILDDYGVFPGVKKITHELIMNETLKFEKYIGLNTIPFIKKDNQIAEPNYSVITDSHEGVILSTKR